MVHLVMMMTWKEIVIDSLLERGEEGFREISFASIGTGKFHF